MIDLTGQQFGRLTVIKQAGRNRWRIYLWLCRCSCENEKIVTGSDLKSNSIKSCGCLLSESNNVKHGHNRNNTPTRTYKSWESMKQRCTNPNDKDYKNYGKRGITVCDRWRNSFPNFLEDMGEQPLGLTIERKDNNKGYSKENCRWITRKQQARNRRNNHLITYNEKTQCLAAWAEKYNIPPNILWMRLKKYKWSVEKALTTSVRKKVKFK